MSMLQISDLNYLDDLKQSNVFGGRLVSVEVDTRTFVDIRLSVGRRSVSLNYGIATGLAAGVSLRGVAIADFNISVTS
ncbi:MAG: hypothetical protein F6K09_12720 [Merismopedia sp. SIO2A8]|nr:hypothetical protein [Merismopedia sp. SIO2A8]